MSLRRLAILGVSLSLLVSGCASMPYTDMVVMQHPQTRMLAYCGPYAWSIYIKDVVMKQFDRCLDDYQRQGYVRVPGP